ARVAVLAVAFLIALGTAGADVTALVAGLSVAGVGVGLAMQGVWSNLFAGLTIIFTKPFRVGEYIQLLGTEGQVDMIELLSTTLRHGDLSRVVIPNRKIVGEILHNYGTVRQLDLTVGVAYQADLAETLATIRDILSRNPRILKDPAPVVGVTMLADCSINIAVKPWTTVADCGPAKAELYQAIVQRFRERNISIPFPQREVRIFLPRAGQSGQFRGVHFEYHGWITAQPAPAVGEDGQLRKFLGDAAHRFEESGRDDSRFRRVHLIQENQRVRFSRYVGD